MDLAILTDRGAVARRSFPLLPPLLLVAGAWTCLALMAGGPGLSGPVMGGPGDLCGVGPERGGAPPLPPHGALMAVSMVGAMMLPCALPGWFRLIHGDWRGGYGFLLGYGLPWAALALAGVAAETAPWPRHPSGAPFVFVVLAAAAVSIFAPPVRGGRAAFTRAALAGLAHGRATLAADAVPMGAVALMGAMDLPAMLAATAGMLALGMLSADRAASLPEPGSPPDRRRPSAGRGHQPNG